MIQRFTAYRRNLASRGTHTIEQRNPDHLPQYEGVIWTDGSVTLRWLTEMHSTSVWDNLRDCLAVHGHPEYGTEIIWDDGKPPHEYLDMMEKWRAEKLINKQL
jgi:hypothetical protein